MTSLQKSVHLNAELLAVVVVAPGLLWAARSLPRGSNQRAFVRAVALGTLIVDGWLLLQWLGQER